MDEEYILLKWGTLKGWRINSSEGQALIQRYRELGVSMSAMAQRNTDEQNQIVCQIIDLTTGVIQLDWTGEYVTKEQAKEYVMTYGSRP